MCGYFQTLNYIQPLWETLAPSATSTIYNGAVEALHTFLSKQIMMILINYLMFEFLPLNRCISHNSDWLCSS